jgi:hypothetical protein
VTAAFAAAPALLLLRLNNSDRVSVCIQERLPVFAEFIFALHAAFGLRTTVGLAFLLLGGHERGARSIQNLQHVWLYASISTAATGCLKRGREIITHGISF